MNCTRGKFDHVVSNGFGIYYMGGGGGGGGGTSNPSRNHEFQRNLVNNENKLSNLYNVDG